MTMLAAAYFVDGAVIIADSRVTWQYKAALKFQDTLQKILPLGKQIAIGYAGDVQAAELIVWIVRRRLQKQPRLQILRNLALYLPRLARRVVKALHSRTGRDIHLAFILAGISSTGVVEVWSFESPDFKPHSISNGFTVLGTGDIVRPFIQQNFEQFNQELPDLKARANALLFGLEGELNRIGIETVGGLLQTITIDHTGIKPLSYGSININPYEPTDAKSMKMEEGRWIQRDIGAGIEVPLIEPAELYKNGPVELRIQDFKRIQRKQAFQRWHLMYLLTCFEIQQDAKTIEFKGVFSEMALPTYPFSLTIPLAIGFWGEGGDHELEILLVKDNISELALKDKIHIEFTMEIVELTAELALKIIEPGPMYFECYIDKQLLGSRAIFFGTREDISASNETEFIEFIRKQEQQLIEQHRECSDLKLEKPNESILVYQAICENAISSNNTVRFEGQIKAVYWKNYPLNLRFFMASAFRMPKGKRQVKVCLVNAETRETAIVNSTIVDSTSSCLSATIHGELIATIPKPGIYFINSYVDEKLVGTSLLFADTDQPKYSYDIGKDGSARVAKGELLYLTQRSQQNPDL